MLSILSPDRLRILLTRIRKRLWVKPLAFCLLSIGGAFLAKLADSTGLGQLVPAVTSESLESLLSVMASSMLVIATFAVASMVSAYASASGSATPRSFALVIADDVSQNALSAFIGAFIYSIVALTATKNGFFDSAGLFTLFAFTVLTFGIVIVTFVRWVDRIARLGRLGETIDRVEKAAAEALRRRRDAPTLGGYPVQSHARPGRAVIAQRVGYLQYLDVGHLQSWCEESDALVEVAALPGTFTAPGRVLAYVRGGTEGETEYDEVVSAFLIGEDRQFDDDPRFGLVVLAEIAGRALSPAVNDPGTAIDILGTLVRLFAEFNEPPSDEAVEPKYDRVEVPEISVRRMFDDAFTAIGRDGAGAVEVAVRTQQALAALAATGSDAMREAARHHQEMALARAELAMDLPQDLERVRQAAASA